MKRNGAGVVYLPTKIARAGVGAAIVLSFLVSLAPLAASAASESHAMACCAGKQGHCKSGVSLKRRSRLAPEPMCGLRPGKNEELTDAEITGGDITSDGITVVATSSEAPTTPDNFEPGLSTKTSSKAPNPPALGASLKRPCPVDCCAGTTSVVRKPRPREIALLRSGGHSIRPQLRFIRIAITRIFPASAYLLRLRPRGPPEITC
jgi:hypothetical protein